MFHNILATCFFYSDKYVNASVRDKIPQSGHSCTVFHVSALEQLMADCSVDAINKIVKAISAVETVQEESLDKLSYEEVVDITALSCEDVGVCVGNVY